jgi:DNA polymerase IV
VRQEKSDDASILLYIYTVKKAIMNNLRTFFVDFNSYFASVQQQIDPALRGRPVGVVPVMAETTCCIAASYEAKRFGVKTGTMVREARKLCPGIIFILAKHEVYVHYHHLAVAAVDRIVPVRQVMSIDEMECELPTRWRTREKATELAAAVKKEILTTVGDQLHTSIGVAPNTLLGKLASDMQKPNGLVILEAKDLPHGLFHLQLQDITGIGRSMLARLNYGGIHSVEQLYAAPRDVLHTVWGGMMGDEMYDKLRGVWYAPRETVARSISHSHMLPPELRNPASAFGVLNRLTQKAAMRLRKQQFYATSMSVSVRSDHRYLAQPSGHRDTRFGETQNTQFFLHTLDKLWQSGLCHLQHPKAVGMVLHGLVPAAMHTLSLFDEVDEQPTTVAPSALTAVATDTGISAPPTRALVRTSADVQNAKAVRNPARLLAAMDIINKTQGKNALYFATAHNALNNAPMRIAFNRIPDMETEQ